jgi:chromosome segregation ATPase
MLQDLDQLATRIERLARRAHQLHGERDALRARLADSENQQGALQRRCGDHEAELVRLNALLADRDKTASLAREQAEQTAAGLREQLALETAERKVLEARLTVRDADLARMRAAAASARERVNAVLSRLPGGAPLEEQA